MYQRILVALDGSPTSEHALAQAIRMARLTQGQLRLVHVIDEMSFAMSMNACAGPVAECLTLLREAGNEILAQAEATVRAAGLPVSSALHETFEGSLQEVVSAEARGWPAELIVLGTHGRRGLGRLVLGSGAESILRHAPVPVLLVRADTAAATTTPATPHAAATELPRNNP